MVATCEIWLVVDSDGNYAVSSEKDAAVEAYDNEVGEDYFGRRVVKLMVKVPQPVTLEAEVEVKDGEPETVNVAVG